MAGRHGFTGCGRPEDQQPDRGNGVQPGENAIAGLAPRRPPGRNAPPAQSGAAPAPACCGVCKCHYDIAWIALAGLFHGALARQLRGRGLTGGWVGGRTPGAAAGARVFFGALMSQMDLDTRCGALDLASQQQMVQRGTMGSEESYLAGAP